MLDVDCEGTRPVRLSATILSLSLIGSLMAPGAVRSQTGRPLSTDAVEQWLRAVERHEPGVADDAVLAIARWTSSDLRLLLRALTDLLRLRGDAQSRLRRTGEPQQVSYRGRVYTLSELHELFALTPEEAGRDRVDRVLKRGALLHTDVALLAPSEDRPSLISSSPEGSGAVVRVQDGRGLWAGGHATHIDFARQLLDEVKPDPSADPIVHGWYVAIAAHLQSQRMYGDVVPHLNRARKLFPQDARLWFHSGVTHEVFSAPEVQTALQSALLEVDVVIEVQSEETELKRAEAYLRRAAELDPAAAEIRLHLGRVLSRQDRRLDAVAELERTLGRLPNPECEYLALLFLGEAEALLGKLDAAQSRFERAAQLVPSAQAPRLSLSDLAHRRGDLAAAQRWLTQGLAVPPDRRFDPWWAYDRLHVENAGALVDAWRKAFPSRVPR